MKIKYIVTDWDKGFQIECDTKEYADSLVAFAEDMGHNVTLKKVEVKGNEEHTISAYSHLGVLNYLPSGLL